MWKFIVKRLIAMVPVLLGVTLIIYLIMNMAPGDPAKVILGEQATPEQIAALREEMHLNDPVLIQYARYILNLLRGDMGTSYNSGLNCATEIFARFPNTLRLTITAVSLSIILALPIGILAAVHQNSVFDGVSMFVALLGLSMPVFWLGMLLILLFSLRLGWLPSSGSEGFKSLVLPGVTLGFQHMAAIARVTRSSMLEVIRADYIRTARAKGVSENKVITKHALKNALIPTVTVIGIQFGGMLGGSVMTESVFAWPGIGRLMVQSINKRDIPMVLGCVIMFSVSFSIVNLIVDILYGFIDPRIKSQYK